MVALQHRSVLLDEAVEQLITDSSGCYFDGTFGRGGHSRLILSHLSESGQLWATDKDPEAIAVAGALQQSDPRFHICHTSFSQAAAIAAEQQLMFDGVLLDLGVSSPQLDDAERGFSFAKDGPLDMRMNPDAGESAADWINRAAEKELADVFWKYGEERYSRRIARAIVKRRAEVPFFRTEDLAAVVSAAHPRWERRIHPATRVFQGIRIHINNELGDLEEFLEAILPFLKPGARIVLISFHSLEDRIAKRFIRDKEKGVLPEGLPVMDADTGGELRKLGKAQKASAAEIEQNPRARSAVMRVAEKLR